MSELEELHLYALPDVPQSTLLRQLAPTLWAQEGVVAIWVGGSLASGTSDRYSDIDLFLAVAPEALYDWLDPDLDALFGGLCLAHLFSRFGSDLFVHHLLLATGEICDLHVQRGEEKVFPAPRIVLGCRTPELRAALEQRDEAQHLNSDALIRMGPVDPSLIQQLLEWYWFDAHKHRKVLYRDLDLLLVSGMQHLHLLLLRLCHILETGQDCGDLRRATIHSMAQVMGALQNRDDLLQVTGMPMRSRSEIEAAVEALNGEVARVGRQLAARHGFAYPAELESLVTRCWSAFKEHRETGGKPEVSL